MDPSESTLWSLLGLAFVLGVTHGSDPDHLTAIDGMTRATVERYPRMSRWIGTWFAIGHSLTVLSIAAVIAFAAGYVGSWSDHLQQAGGVLSALLLFVIGTINVMKLVQSSDETANDNQTPIRPLWLQSVKIATLRTPFRSAHYSDWDLKRPAKWLLGDWPGRWVLAIRGRSL